MTRPASRTLARYGLGDGDRIAKELTVLGLAANGVALPESHDVMAAISRAGRPIWPSMGWPR